MKTLAIASATIALAFTATPAFAEEPASVSISVKDIDLGTADGQRELENRIDNAARAVCGFDEIRTGTRIRSLSARQCVEKARADVAKQVATLIQDQQRGG